eukprot:CAMPEP_0175070010 /NCGR_PEP_ID=MMETSP0052_2-20121109/18490_1 /TAXON_ID=51329 ORGANISM="Polytomella parva, Strain SAG 63-3" /NCGR_SAMPLE_ID=MMETSP0052_2 /ASSEMBLY_ACC=CAM_ASM_000194 /LENGTH=566 /DNA_ID=CAMNT_0016337103 /DNA_START=296 /DNA_END=1996 /DNA_ORIENTATION=+
MIEQVIACEGEAAVEVLVIIHRFVLSDPPPPTPPPVKTVAPSAGKPSSEASPHFIPFNPPAREYSDILNPALISSNVNPYPIASPYSTPLLTPVNSTPNSNNNSNNNNNTMMMMMMMNGISGGSDGNGYRYGNDLNNNNAYPSAYTSLAASSDMGYGALPYASMPPYATPLMSALPPAYPSAPTAPVTNFGPSFMPQIGGSAGRGGEGVMDGPSAKRFPSSSGNSNSSNSNAVGAKAGMEGNKKVGGSSSSSSNSNKGKAKDKTVVSQLTHQALKVHTQQHQSLEEQQQQKQQQLMAEMTEQYQQIVTGLGSNGLPLKAEQMALMQQKYMQQMTAYQQQFGAGESRGVGGGGNAYSAGIASTPYGVPATKSNPVPDVYDNPHADVSNEFSPTGKDALAYSRKPRPVEYQPYDMQDYIDKGYAPGAVASNGSSNSKANAGPRNGYWELGHLGPDLETEELQAKREKQERMKQLAKEIKDKNAAAVAAAASNPKPKQKVMEPTARQKALEFAKNVPKPEVKPKKTVEAKTNVSQKNVESETELERLEREHQEQQLAVEAIRAEMQRVM